MPLRRGYIERLTGSSYKMPFISIVIPVYNMAEGIGRCLQSLIDQRSEGIEIIVVDDGSSDNTASVVSRFAAIDSRIKYSFRQNAGVSSARNMGIKTANGKYLLFIDADDKIEANYLQNIINQARATEADMLIWGIKLCYADGHVEEWKPEIEGLFDRKVFLEAFPSEQYGPHEGLYGFVSNKLVKKEIVDRFDLHFDTEMSLMEDYDFFLDCYSHCDSFFCFPETGYLYNIGNSGRYSDSLYLQLIGVHTKCTNLLKSEGILTAENDRLLTRSIANLSLASFLEMRNAGYHKVKSCMDFLWDNPYCIPAIKTRDTRWKLLKRLILERRVFGALLFMALWRSYLFIRTKGKV